LSYITAEEDTLGTDDDRVHDPREAVPASDGLAALLARKVVGQPSALEVIVPCVQLHNSGLAPVGRPVGVFLFLGPTGTGKTRTVEALAEVLHGSPDKLLRIDCGEFQSDHEIAKLIGAPPGYVGHAQSTPRLTAGSLEDARSEECDLALVLFDEIEKAAPAMYQLLLGVLERAELRLGDGGTVDFTKSLIFLTSNLGARSMMEEIKPALGFDSGSARDPVELRSRLENIGLRAVKRHFSPEFLNRIDAVVTYRPLDAASIIAILHHHIAELQQHVHTRLGSRSFDIEVAPAARYFMVDKGTSLEYGARELRRVIHRNLTQPLAVMVASGRVRPGSTVQVDLAESGEVLTLVTGEGLQAAPREIETVLAVDDNADLLGWMERTLTGEGWKALAASSAREAMVAVREGRPDAVIIDYMLPDGDGVSLASAVIREAPDVRIVMMSGMDMDEEDELVCRVHGFPILVKPFLADELLAALESHEAGHDAAKAEGA
jgi:CheY-like chemotaxis protein